MGGKNLVAVENATRNGPWPNFVDILLYIQYTTEQEVGRPMKYTWDEKKNESNFRKHGVWFEEACSVFADKNALEMFDDENSSENEPRYIVLGLATSLRLLVVIYCERDQDQIRLISARKATKKESRDYEKGI